MRNVRIIAGRELAGYFITPLALVFIVIFLAVTGAFAFANADPAALIGKQRQAFANGFLGTTSFGRSTLVEVAEIDEAGHADVIQRLALHFITD